MSLWDRYLAASPRKTSRRPVQDRMVEILATHRDAVISAPTGVGKTRAAIIGKLMWLTEQYPDKSTRPTLVIATSNKKLQDQYEAELREINKVLRSKLRLNIRFTVLMGRNSYACKASTAYAELDESGRARIDTDGGRTRNVELKVEEDKCAGTNCPLQGECYYYRLKSLANSPDMRVVITNHAQYIHARRYPNSNLFTQDHILVIDECHDLLDNLTSALSYSLTFRDLPGDEIIRMEWKQYLDGLDDVPDIGELRSKLQPWKSLAVKIKAEIDSASDHHKSHGYLGDDCSCDIDYEMLSSCESIIEKIAAVGKENYVIALETSPRNKLMLKPIQVGGWARKAIWEHVPHTLVSATPGTKSTLRGLLGVEAELFQLPHIFDYRRTALHFSVDAPNPPDSYEGPEAVEQYARRVWAYILPMIRATTGGVLVLSPNKSHYRALYAIAGRSIGGERPLMLQAEESDAEEQTSRMKRQPGCVLFGTKTFYAGIDLPGDALHLVVLTRLPYDRPDPLSRAREQAAGFYATQRAPMMMRTAQVFGRINRTPDDWGAFVLLDNRVIEQSLALQSSTTPGAIPAAARRMDRAEVVRYLRNGPSARK